MQELLKFLKRKNSWPNWLIIFFTLPKLNNRIPIGDHTSYQQLFEKTLKKYISQV